MSSRKSFYRWCMRSCALLLAVTGLSIQTVQASTFVQVNTSLGNFLLELLDSTTPGTVSNFLNYVNSGRYNGTVIHRSEPGFVIQGGWLTYEESITNFSPIAADPNIVNEPIVSNTRGTIAMAKLDGDPDSANSQWFINLADNISLDTANGGFTAFGRVLGDGMDVVDAISNLQRWILVAESPFPTIDFDDTAPLLSANLVNVTMAVVPGPANHLEPITNLLKIKVDGGAEGIASVAFTVNSTSPEAVIQLVPESIVGLAETATDFATFDAATSRLVIPELVVDGVVAYQNLVFELTNAELFQFTLVQ